MIQAAHVTNLHDAVQAWESGARQIHCTKKRPRPAHCPPSMAKQCCTTRPQVYNFYTGKAAPDVTRTPVVVAQAQPVHNLKPTPTDPVVAEADAKALEQVDAILT